MSFMQSVTDAIANPKRVRLSQERASARRLSGLEPKMKAVRDTSPECVPGVVGVPIYRTDSSLSLTAPSKSSSREHSRPPSRAPSVASKRAVRPTAQLLRSQSELPFKSPLMRPQTEFPPDITTMDLSNDQMKHNYSSDDLVTWDKSKFHMPPMGQMRGFGRYRTSVNADPEWYYTHVKKHTKDIADVLPLGQLDMESMTGVSNESWKAVTDPWVRRDSVISLLSTATDSSTEARSPCFLSPSDSSTKSSLAFHTHGRKGSTLSTMNLPTDSDPSSPPCILQRTSTLLSERRDSGPLTTIEETQTVRSSTTEGHRKIEKPCDFSASGDPDSAVASDAEEEDGDEEVWTDMEETSPIKVSAITRMIKEGKMPTSQVQQQAQTGLTRIRTSSSDKKRGYGSTVTLDRNKTIRGGRPDMKRRQSKNQSMQIVACK